VKGATTSQLIADGLALHHRFETRRMCRELLDQFFWRAIEEDRLDQAEIIFHLMERLWPDPESLRRVREQRAQGATV
jgi:hypothetical protein